MEQPNSPVKGPESVTQPAQNSAPKQQRYFTTRRMVTIAVIAAVMCVVSPFSLPIGPVPISLATLVVMLGAYILGPVDSMLAVAVYLLIGLVGLPVFSGFSGGAQKLVGPTGGYLIGYLLLACVGGFITRLALVKKERSIVLYYVISVLGMVLGTAALYFFGTAWFCYQAQYTVSAALAVCVVPFLAGDAIKIVLATAFGPIIRGRIFGAGR